MKRLKQILSVLMVCCMVFTSLPITAKALTIDGTTVIGKQYYPVSSDSGNGNWAFCGLVVDEKNKVHLVLGNVNNNDKLDDQTTLYIVYNDASKSYCFGHDYPNDGMTPKGDLVYKFIKSSSYDIAIADDEGNIIGTNKITASVKDKDVKTYYFFEIGGMEVFQDSFKIGLDTKTGGSDGGNAWDIGTPPSAGTDVVVHYDYGITKTVVKDEDGDTVFENTEDERITYTVTIANKSDQGDGGTGILLPIKADYVYDYIPEGLTVNLEDNKDADGNLLYSFAKDTEGNDITNQLVLDTNVTLTPDGENKTRTYTIVARIDPDFKGGVVRNTAVMGGKELVPKEDTADVTINSYFYVHHIKNDGKVGHESGVEERIDKVLFNEVLGRTYYVDSNNDSKLDENDEIEVNHTLSKFNVNANGGGVNAESKIQTLEDETIGTKTFVDGTYDGLLDNTLYGGTFEADYTTLHNQFNKKHSDYKDDENGIDFTPEVNEHYYVWEPTDKYLRPINLAVWHVESGGWNPVNPGITQYHTVAGYPVTAVDREYYQQFGFVENEDVTPETIYETVKAQSNFDNTNTSELNAQKFGLTGYLGIYKFPGTFFNNNVTAGETFLPYWVTCDGVKVTGIYQRNAKYSDLGTEISNKMFNIEDQYGKYSVAKYEAPGNTPLMAKAMFYDNSLTHPLIPEMAGVAFEGITAGKSGNVKGVKLTLDLSEFKYDRVWFDVNGEMVEAQEKDGMLSAEISQKKDAELTVVPHWSYGDKEFTGAAKLLNVTKNNVEDITPAAPFASGRMSAASFRTMMSLNEEISGVILQQGGMN